MNKWKPAGRLMLLVMLALMLMGTAAAESSPLYNLLALVPAPEAEAPLYVSYVDYEALTEGRPLAQAQAAAAGGNPDVYRGLDRMDARETSGIALPMLKQNLHAVLPPFQLTLLAGDFDQQALEAALLAQDYQALEDSGGADAAWCLGGDCDSILGDSLVRSNPAFFFGGAQGENWPVALFGNALATTRDVALFARVKDREGRSLLDLEAVQALLAALQPDGAAPLSQLAVVDTQSALGEGFSPDRLLAVAQTQEGEALVVQLLVQFDQAAEAQAARDWLKAGLPEVQLKSGGTLTGSLEALEGSLQEVEAEDSLLRLRFHFPGGAGNESEAPERPADTPFGMFHMLLMYLDLGWLVA